MKRLRHDRVAGNIGWLLSGRVFRLGFGFFIGILLARYLGPGQLGSLSYALSLKAFFANFVYLGLSGLVVRELVRTPEEENLIFGTTFFLKLTGSVLGFIALLFVALFSHKTSPQESLLVTILAFSLFPAALDCLDFWFQAKTQSKYIVLSQNISFVFFALFKLAGIYLKLDLVFFAILASTEILLSKALLWSYYKIHGGLISSWRFSMTKAIQLLSECWIIILSGFFAMINMRVDQIMLRVMQGATEVGFYSIAANLSEVWYFIPNAIAISFYPKLIELKKTNSILYAKTLQDAFDLLFVISASVALLCQFLADFAVPFLYGIEFQPTASILKIHIWAGIFMFQRALLSKWFFIEDALPLSLWSHGLGALVNVMLNLALIPSMKGEGAAIATLLSYATSSYLFLFCWNRTRPVANMMTKSFILPFRKILAPKNRLKDRE